MLFSSLMEMLLSTKYVSPAKGPSVWFKAVDWLTDWPHDV